MHRFLDGGLWPGNGSSFKRRRLARSGVDVKQRACSSMRDRGLDVTQAELVDLLRSIPMGHSARICFHIVEHLPLERLILFSMKPCVRWFEWPHPMETPNPRNLRSGSCNFYFDPSHRNPLPDPVLRFLVESRGFIVSEALGSIRRMRSACRRLESGPGVSMILLWAQWTMRSSPQS